MKIILGVEIGEKYLKLVNVSRRGIQLKLSRCITRPILGFKDDEISAVISDIVKRDKHKSRTISVSLPSNLVTVRNLHLPSQNREEIDKMVRLHIDRIVPYKREEIVFSYFLSGQDNMKYTRVILAIVHSDIIKRQIKILDQAGFLIDRIVLSSYGLWHWVINKHRLEMVAAELYLILDIDTVFTDFIICSRDNMLFCRSISVKAAEIEKELGRRKLLGEIRQSLLIFQNEEGSRRPVEIFLGGMRVPELKTVIEKELNVKVKFVVNPLPLELLEEGEEALAQDTSYTSISNFLLEDKQQKLAFVLPEIQVKKSLKEKIKDLFILGSLIIYIFIIICVFFIGQIYQRKNYLEDVKQRYSKIGAEVDNLVQQIDNLEFVKDQLNTRRIPLFILHQLQEVIPQNMSLNYVSITEDRLVSIRGQAYQLSDIFALVTKLEEISHFREVGTKSARQRRVQDKEITEFEIGFKFDVENK